MVEEIGHNRPNPRLLEGRHPAQRASARVRRDEVFVANIAEKRYLWTARAFAVVISISGI